MRRRAPYKRIKIEMINRADIKRDDEQRWRLISLNGNSIFRVWIVGIVTNKYEGENNYIGITIEDGSGAIRVKSWDGRLEDINEWDKLEVLGQIQISEQDELVEVFITPDIIEPITDDNWFIYHKLKIIQHDQKSDFEVEVQSAKMDGVDLGIASLEDLKVQLKRIVKQLDKGSGVTMDMIMEKIPKVDESQIYDAITELLESGEFFEPQVGKYQNAYQ